MPKRDVYWSAVQIRMIPKELRPQCRISHLWADTRLCIFLSRPICIVDKRIKRRGKAVPLQAMEVHLHSF